MPKLHVLLKKEEIEDVQMQEDKIAVIDDVLLATSTIIACFWQRAKEVVPVLNREEALREANGREAGS